MEGAAQPEGVAQPGAAAGPESPAAAAQAGTAARLESGPGRAPAAPPGDDAGALPSPLGEPTPSRFNVRTVLLLSGAHFVHDAYPAFTGVMLPLLIDKLSLTIGQAGLMATGRSPSATWPTGSTRATW